MDKFFLSLNKEQKKIVENDSKNPVLVLSGPGSGKTRVVIAKIIHLITNKDLGICSEDILALTFTNKAASEMSIRLNFVLGLNQQKLNIQTFHSFGVRFLRFYCKNFDSSYDSSFTIWDSNDVARFLKQIDLASNIELAKNLANSILKSKENILKKNENFDENFYKKVEIYEAEKAKNNAFDFADLIIKPVLILQKSEKIKTKIQSKFKAIFCDEYQDTNYAQFLLLKELYKDGMYFMVVGDEDQSIYSFRGARIKNILEFEKTFKGVEKFYLMQNYRSTLNVVNIANNVISKNKNRYEKQIKTENDQGKRVKLFVFQNSIYEAEYVSNLFLKDFIETSIIYRFNYQSLQFEKAFLKRNIPYKILGSIRFYEREEIKDIISLLRIFVNRRDKISFLRIINKPAKGIGKSSIYKIISMLSNPDINFDLILALKKFSFSDKCRSKSSLVSFLNFYTSFSEKINTGSYINLSVFINEVVEKFGFWHYYRKLDIDEKIRNIDELIGSGIGYKGNFEGLVLFLENSSINPLIHGDSNSNILLSSIHGVKGLEFERVIISGLEKGVFPAEIEELTQEKLEEERRLFYVAITRAKSELIITMNLQRVAKGVLTNSVPSAFFHDLNQNSYDIIFVPEYLKDNFDCFFKSNDVYDFNIGDYIFYNGESGVVIDKWHQEDEQFIKIDLKNGKKAILSPCYTKRLFKFRGVKR